MGLLGLPGSALPAPVRRYRRTIAALITIGKWWLYSEIAYYVYFRLRLIAVQRFQPPLTMTRQQRSFLSKRVIQAVEMAHDNGLPSVDKHLGIRKFFSGWFKEAAFDDLKKDNIAEYISMHEHGLLWREQTEEGKEEVYELIERLEASAGKQFPEGYNREVEVMCPAFEQVRAWYRPLAIYITIICMKSFLNLKLSLDGFRSFYSGRLRYWYLPARTARSEAKDPIVFLHGISPGLLPYYPFLSHFIKDRNRDLFLVELPWVSMRAYTDVPDSKEFVRCLDAMLNQHGIESACFVGHSYGTVVCSWVIKHCPRVLKSLVLLDPVSIMIVLPDVAANFLHMRSIQNRKQRLGYLKLFLLLAFFYISAREIGIAETLSRYLRWQETNIWAEELPNNTTVVLSSRDAIVPSEKVRNYLERYNEKLNNNELREIELSDSEETKTCDDVAPLNSKMMDSKRNEPIFVVWQDGMPHGGFLFSNTEQLQVVEYIKAKH